MMSNIRIVVVIVVVVVVIIIIIMMVVVVIVLMLVFAAASMVSIVVVGCVFFCFQFFPRVCFDFFPSHYFVFKQQLKQPRTVVPNRFSYGINFFEWNTTYVYRD